MAGVVATVGAGVEGAGDFAGGGGATGGAITGAGVGLFFAIIGGGETAGDGVGVAFLFLASFPPFGVGVAFAGGGAGVAIATFGASTCWAGSTRINAFSAGGGGVGRVPRQRQPADSVQRAHGSVTPQRAGSIP